MDVTKAPALTKPRSLRKLDEGASEDKREVVSDSNLIQHPLSLLAATEWFSLPFFDTQTAGLGGQPCHVTAQVLMKRDKFRYFLATPFIGGVNIMLPRLVVDKAYTADLSPVLSQRVT